MAKDRHQRQPRSSPQLTVITASLAPGDQLRPWLLAAVCTLFVARPLFPSEGAPESGDGLPVVMLWVALTVVWLLGAIGRKEFRFRFGATDAVFMILVGWYVVSAIPAAVYGSPRPAINVLWEWIGVALALLLVRQVVASRREARAIVAVMIALAVALAVVGLYQYFYEMPKTLYEYGRDPEVKLREIGMWRPPGSPERRAFELRLGAREPIATFALTNSLAGFLVAWLAMAVGIAASAGLNRRNLRILVACVVAVVVMAVCLVLTKSRSAYLAALVSLLPAWWVGRNQRQNWNRSTAALAAATLAAITAVVGLGIGVGALDYQVLDEATKSLGYRLQYWQASLAMIADHPLFGVGPGQFQDAYTAYKLPAASEEIADPHNFLLEVWATAGTPAAIALLAAIALFGATLLRRTRRTSDSASDGTFNSETATTIQNSGSNSLPEIASADATLFALAGGGSGFLLALPLGLMSSAPPGWIAIVLGLPAAFIFAASLRPWIQSGQLPTLLPGVALFVLLFNLLAAGGIGFAGVAGSLWLLLALGLNLADHSPSRLVGRWAALAGMGVAMLAAIACYFSAYRPVLESRPLIEAAYQEPQRARELLLHAASADPLAAQPQMQLAMLAFARWKQTGSPVDFQEFEEHQSQALKRDPHSSSAWAQAGRLYFEAYKATQKRGLADRSVEVYRRAVDRYPTNPDCRAELSLSLLASGDQAAFQDQAMQALRLHESTPHEDKKLKPALEDELRKHLPRNSSGAK